jgi:hypothetical protein
MTTARRGTLHKLALAGALVAAAAAPLSLAIPAHAASSSGCIVNPQKPVHAGFNSAGVKLVRFEVKIFCNPNRTVEVQQLRYEEDWGNWLFSDPDDSLGSRTFTRTFPPNVGTITVSSTRTLPNTEDGNEEIYQKTRFRVSSGGVTSPWTSYQRTAYVSMPN